MGEDRSLNTTTGRAASLPRPDYRPNEVWRPCDFGRHVLPKFDGFCYGCHYALRTSRLGALSTLGLSNALRELGESSLGRVLHDSGSRRYYETVCRNYGVDFLTNRCLLCEEFANRGIDVFREAEIWLEEEDDGEG